MATEGGRSEPLEGEEATEWERESTRSEEMVERRSKGEGDGGEGGVEEQLKKKMMMERRKKREEEEELGERQKRRAEEEGEKRREEERMEKGMTMEEKIWEVEKGLRDIVGAVSREGAEGKSKIAFGRGEQQIVKNAVFRIQEKIIGILVEQLEMERRNRRLEEECDKRHDEHDRNRVNTCVFSVQYKISNFKL